MDKRKKHFARLRAEEKRRKPLTKAQKKNQMCTYLKNMARFTHNQLKNKSFDEVQKAFDKTMSWIDSFVPMDSEVVKGSKDKAEGTTKSPIVDWKTQILGEEIYYQIKRADRSYKMYKIFSEMLNDFDRQDLIDLYRLVTERFKTTRPEGSDKLLWGDLMTIFEPSEEDELWRNQQDYTLISWELYDSCGVHSLLMDTVYIHMLENKIVATMKQRFCRKFEKCIEEGKCVYISTFRVGESQGSPYIVDTYSVPMYGFKFKSFASLLQEEQSSNVSYDLIGDLPSCGNIEYVMVDGNRRPFIRWSWRMYRKLVVSSMSGATKLFINDEIPDIHNFKNLLIENHGLEGEDHRVTHLKTFSSYSIKHRFLNNLQKVTLNDICDIGKQLLRSSTTKSSVIPILDKSATELVQEVSKETWTFSLRTLTNSILNALKLSGIPNHILALKVGASVMLL
ncbi:hypothetical protein Tco_0456268 [Tanacetum coccineum]